MLFAIILILISLAVLYFVKYARNGRSLPKGKSVPFHRALPIIGMAFEINESTGMYTLAELAKRYGEIFSFNIFGQNVVVMNSEPLLRKAYSSEKYRNHFSDKPESFYGKYFRPGGNSVAFTPDGTGYTYKRIKKLYMKALHTYGNGVQDLENKILSELNNLVNRIDSLNSEKFIFVDFLKQSLANVIAVVLVGEHLQNGSEDGKLLWETTDVENFFISHYVECVLSTFPILRHVPFTRFGRMYRVGKQIHKRIVERFFHPIKATHKPGDETGIVRFYLEQQRKEKDAGREDFITDDIIISQLIETIDAGMITSWSLIANSMLILVNHPEYQIKIQEEVDRVIGQERSPSVNDRLKCHFLMAFEKEALRYTPVSPLNLPHMCHENIEFEGYDIKKNSLIVSNFWFIYHDERIWGDPWNFRPERFLDENGELLPAEHLYCRSVNAFGLGERRCPGEMFGKTRFFLYMATFFQRYSFETPEGVKQRGCDPRTLEDFDNSLVLRAKPFWVRAVPR